MAGERLNLTEYTAKVLACLPDEKASILADRDRVLQTARTQACFHRRQSSDILNLEDVEHFNSSKDDGVVVVVENIDLRWLAVLGDAWNIAPSFFAAHAHNPAGARLWQSVFGTTPADRQRDNDASTVALTPRSQDGVWSQPYQWHIDGVVSCEQTTGLAGSEMTSPNFMPRRVVSNEYGLQTSTRISLWYEHSDARSLCLILVDTLGFSGDHNASLQRSAPPSQLYLPISRNRGGLAIPRLHDQGKLSLYDILRNALSHAWHFNVLFANSHRIVGLEVFWYLIVASTWETKFRSLDKEVKRLGFYGIRRPTKDISDQLHDRRQDLDHLQKQVDVILHWIPGSVEDLLNAIQARAGSEQIYVGLPSDGLKNTLLRAQNLERFLMDSFNLLISSSNVMVAESAVQQAKRSQMLTILAFVYIPLSFVTSVFGMNIKEINGSPLSIWAAIVAVVVALILTAGIYTACSSWESRQKKA